MISGLLTLALVVLLQTPQPVSYHIEDGAGVNGYDAADRELAQLALEAWSRESGGKLRFVRAAVPAEALLRIRWTEGQGQFGEMQRIEVRGKPGAIVYVAPVISSTPPYASHVRKDRLFRDVMVYLTCVHEIGHALGLSHTSDFADIMYSFQYGGDLVEYFQRYRRQLKSRSDIGKFSGLSAGDIAVLKAMY
jgi:hypothetical protein